jgi:hypothetical protein
MTTPAISLRLMVSDSSYTGPGGERKKSMNPFGTFIAPHAFALHSVAPLNGETPVPVASQRASIVGRHDSHGSDRSKCQVGDHHD